MRLSLRPIEPDLSAGTESVIPPAVPPDDRELWRDSSLDLKRGLDVIELPVDMPVDQAQERSPATD